MKLRKFGIACIATLIYLNVCGNTCSPANLLLDCGLLINIRKPIGVDSIRVNIYNDESFVFSARDSLSCEKCGNTDVYLRKSKSDLAKIRGFKYGEFYLEEIAYCGNVKSIFPRISFSISENRLAFIETFNEASSGYGNLFIPVDENCAIDSTYKIVVENYEECEE